MSVFAFLVATVQCFIIMILLFYCLFVSHFILHSWLINWLDLTCTGKAQLTGRSGIVEALQLEGRWRSHLSFWALITRPIMQQPTNSTVLQGIFVFYCTFVFLYNIVSGQLALLLLINNNNFSAVGEHSSMFLPNPYCACAKTATSQFPVNILPLPLDSLTLWPFDLEHVSHVPLCTGIISPGLNSVNFSVRDL